MMMINLNLIPGNWKLHRDNLYNGHLIIDITESNIQASNSMSYIIGLPKLSTEQLEVVDVTEKCMILKEGLVIYILFRNQ